PTVWSTGTVPAAGDGVAIKPGHTVTYNVASDAALGDVSVEGVLKFSRTANTKLKTSGNVLVLNGGYLDMGNTSSVMPPGVRAELVFVLTDAQSKAYVGGALFQAADKGLWVMMGGRWDAHGTPVVRTWSKLAQDGAAGSTAVTVENDVSDWPVGGTVVVSSTRDPVNTASQNELHTIKAVNGKTITLNAALKYVHGGVAPYRGEVALLSRNVVYRTEIAGVAESVYANNVRTRKFAHTMYMYGAKGDLQYAEFKYMGNYGKAGRYAIHYHMMKESSRGTVVRGTSGWYSGFRCVNLHVTQQVLLEDNVCYSSSSTSYFVEIDPAVGHNLDNVFVHNIGIGMLPKHFDDRNNSAIAGESRRSAVDFWPGTAHNEAFLGNVSVGDGGSGDWGSLGYHFPEIGATKEGVGGVMPWTMAHNEVHSKTVVGINSWQNGAPSRDIVDMLIWRNKAGGIVWGAYNQNNKYYGAQVLQNGGMALEVTSTNSFLQDSVVAGNGAANNIGFRINAYILPQTPVTPVWLVRNIFKDLKTAGIALDHTACGDASLEKRPIIATGCSAVYMAGFGNIYQNVGVPLDFGWQANANSIVKFFDNVVAGVTSPSVVVLRKDQQNGTKQGPITAKLVTGQSNYSAAFNALTTPAGSLPALIQYIGLTPARPSVEPPVDYTFTSVPDYPPKVSLTVSRNGTQAILKASPTDDKALTRVEFFVDWIKVGTRTAAPYEVTVDLASLPADGTSLPKRKYAYLYVRAFDGIQQIKGYEQRSYSQIVEVGP
ncbi:MAG TPA: G8 domain-containing protein, partial [Dehalococcoidia bacterium]|nr:G8 domain-containing protein [Dehalococcoidia bacterium]